jgi:catechol 2,3-dioxygenase-like lactoylglutathione lyase family enzyme
MNAVPQLAAVGLPQVAQIGLVVRDIDRYMELYGPMFGPWQRFDGSVPGATYRGRVADAELEVAIGYSGSVEVELIQWKSGESPHREFIEQGREGMHHVQFRVDDADAWITRVAPLGYRPIWYKVWCADTKFVYLEREGDPLIIEFLEMPPGGPGTGGK